MGRYRVRAIGRNAYAYRQILVISFEFSIPTSCNSLTFLRAPNSAQHLPTLDTKISLPYNFLFFFKTQIFIGMNSQRRKMFIAMKI